MLQIRVKLIWTDVVSRPQSLLACQDMREIFFTQTTYSKNIIQILYAQAGLFSQAPTKQEQAMK